jgi:hypothetical protein
MLIKYSIKRPGIERGGDVKGQCGFSDNQTTGHPGVEMTFKNQVHSSGMKCKVRVCEPNKSSLPVVNFEKHVVCLNDASYAVESSYNDYCMWHMSSITSDILWCQSITQC